MLNFTTDFFRGLNGSVTLGQTPAVNSFLLLEDGISKFLLEDGSGNLLME